MSTKSIIGIIALIIIVLLAAYFIFIPHYKAVEMSGYTFEVPESNAEVKNNTVNYNTYQDKENDINIKTWACKDINDINGTVNGSLEIGMQLEQNSGNNITYNNITLINKTGNYTYYDTDTNNTSMIIITSKNPDIIQHIVETMKKPQINIDTNQLNITANPLNTSEPTNNTTTENQSII